MGLGRRWDLVDASELKSRAIRSFLICLSCSIVCSIFLFMFIRNIFIIEFTFIGFLLTSVYYSILIYKRDWLDEKIGLFDPYLQGISYQGSVILLSSASFALSFAFFALAFVKGGIYSAVSTCLCINFPTVFMLLRLNVYNNDSRLLYVGKLDGMDHYEQVFGYNPIVYYMLLGVPFGWGILGVSFRRVLESIFLHNYSLEYSLLCFILCLLVGSFILSPDIANNVFPFEIKRYKGFFKFAIVSLILMEICFVPLII